MSDQEIAEKMVEIVDEFQRQTGMPDEVADSVVRHCFRKMELIDEIGRASCRERV